ncbi:LptF/LptG family permease [Treponema sp.]|uniref:LptF/LptG family permease n=1 Tax=Treponema sp. TaxID=166 RepID=UPI00298DB6D1|nr:LptF/LptG family permease [Treponema sp.]MCQ2241067.1 LptF/LptG family permease [Treponema sp.]
MKILYARKTRNLKKIKARRFLFRAGYALGKKINSRPLMRFFSRQYFKVNALGSGILVKYIAKELLLYFVVCFTFFFVVFFVNQILLLAETILKKRVPLGSVIKLITYCLPAIIAQSAPFATLVGFLMCLGRLVTDNELLIFRASGQKYSLIFKSVLAMGMLISIFSFIMNDYFLPLGTINYNRMRRQIITSNPAIELESMSIKRMNDSIFVIGKVNGTMVSDLVFFDTGNDGNARVIVAKNSEIRKSSQDGVLMKLDMKNPIVMMMKNIQSGSYDTLSSENLSLSIFEDSIISSSGGVSPREMTSWDLRKKIKSVRNDDTVSPKIKNTYKLEYNKKFSIPFGSIFFAILAFPLSLIFGRKDGQTLGLIFGIILSVLYWAATIIGQMFGVKGGYNGFWMMWTPNLVLGFLGILLYLRLRRK